MSKKCAELEVLKDYGWGNLLMLQSLKGKLLHAMALVQFPLFFKVIAMIAAAARNKLAYAKDVSQEPVESLM